MGQDSVIGILLTTGWMVLGSNPGGGVRFSTPIKTRPGAHPNVCTMGTGVIPGGKAAGA